MQFTMKLGVFRLDNLDPEVFEEVNFEKKSLMSGKNYASRVSKQNKMLKIYYSHPTWTEWMHEGIISSDQETNIFSCVKVTRKPVKYKGVLYKGYVRLHWQKLKSQ